MPIKQLIIWIALGISCNLWGQSIVNIRQYYKKEVRKIETFDLQQKYDSAYIIARKLYDFIPSDSTTYRIKALCLMAIEKSQLRDYTYSDSLCKVAHNRIDSMPIPQVIYSLQEAEAQINFLRGKYTQAIPQFQALIEVYSQEDAKKIKASLALCYIQIGKYVEAKSLLVPLFEEMTMRDMGYQTVVQYLMTLYIQMGDEQNFNNLIKKVKETTQATDLIYAHLEGLYCLENGYIHEGIDLLETTQQVFETKKLTKHPSYLTTLSTLAQGYYLTQDIEFAEKLLIQTIDTTTKYRYDIFLPQIRLALAMGYISQKYKDKDDFIESVFADFSPKDLAYKQVLMNAAIFYQRKKNELKRDSVIMLLHDFLAQTQSPKDSMHIYHTFMRLETQKGETSKAAEHTAIIEKYANKLHNSFSTLHIQLHGYQSYIQYLLGNEAAAIKYANMGISKIDSITRSIFPIFSERQRLLSLKNLQGVLNNSQSLLIETEDRQLRENCLNTLLTYRQAVLRSSLAEKKIVSQDSSLQKTYLKWVSKQQERVDFMMNVKNNVLKDPKLTKLTYSIDSLEKILHHKIYDFSTYKPLLSQNWHEVKQSLKKGEVAILLSQVKYFPILEQEKDSLLFLAYLITDTSISPACVLYHNGNFLAKNGKNIYWNELKNQNQERKALLYYWQPIADKLPNGTHTVFFSADGVFHDLNLNALQDNSGSFLLEKLQINICNNLLDIKNYKQKHSSNKPSIILACAGNLPYTATEIHNITQLLKQHHIANKLFTFPNATESSIKNIKSPGILHIASHAQWQETNDLVLSLSQSYLMLEADSQNDGKLTAYELSNMDLQNTDIVMLNSCKSARGNHIYNEGVYGLQRACKVAGAKYIVATLWNIEDKIAAKMGELMYSIWLEKPNEDIDKIFLAAINKLRESCNNNTDWAAFILIY